MFRIFLSSLDSKVEGSPLKLIIVEGSVTGQGAQSAGKQSWRNGLSGFGNSLVTVTAAEEGIQKVGDGKEKHKFFKN